jgi:uncharacterized protein with GYD domain
LRKPMARSSRLSVDLMEKAGAKLLAHYFTFGEYDFLSIAEAPNEEVMASALIAGRRRAGFPT